MSLPEQLPQPRVPQDATLRERINYWQGIFDKIPYDNDSVDELRESAVNDLDAHWAIGPGEPCLYSGAGRRAAFNGEPAYSDYFECEEGTNQGFLVERVDRTQKWRVCFALAKVVRIDHDAYDFEETFLYPETASILPFEAVEEVFNHVPSVRHILLNDAADELKRNLDDPKFFKLTIEEQRHYIDQTIRKTREDINNNDAITNQPVSIANTDIVYVRNSTRRAGELAYIPHYVGRGTELNGKCIDVDVLARQQLREGRRITSREELVCPGGGLFLVVALNPDSAKTIDLSKNEEIYIPIASNKDLEVMFSDSSTINSNGL